MILCFLVYLCYCLFLFMLVIMFVRIKREREREFKSEIYSVRKEKGRVSLLCIKECRNSFLFYIRLYVFAGFIFCLQVFT